MRKLKIYYARSWDYEDKELVEGMRENLDILKEILTEFMKVEIKIIDARRERIPKPLPKKIEELIRESNGLFALLTKVKRVRIKKEEERIDTLGEIRKANESGITIAVLMEKERIPKKIVKEIYGYGDTVDFKREEFYNSAGQFVSLIKNLIRLIIEKESLARKNKNIK